MQAKMRKDIDPPVDLFAQALYLLETGGNPPSPLTFTPFADDERI
jgi:hypothetical protein